MDIYQIKAPVLVHQFVHPQDKVGPIWTGQVVQANIAVRQVAAINPVGQQRTG